jgi:UDP-3-O-[3-hydroxymyristoyl] N-acetylglucosamine deacetylase/3-hydroxyacyl-[acyl-carrier-protein] dehydratase
VTFNLDYGHAAGIGRQSLTVGVDPDFFRTQIAPARTFVLLSEVEQLRRQGLGRRSSAKDLLVFGEDGWPVENELRFPDECVRHKILDVIGDFALLGRPLSGHVLAHKSGHRLNARLVKKLSRTLAAQADGMQMAGRPLLGVEQIEKIIPHRYPFLLVDRVLQLDPDRGAVGVKNVSYNEPFFQGHWPGKPVMPGVLIIEAMAQLAGILLTQWQEKDAQFGMLVSLNGIKLRRSVTPGDQLLLEAETVRVKARTAVLATRARVGQELVAEAQMRFVVVDDDDSPGD